MSRTVVSVLTAVVLCATVSVALPTSAAAQRGSPSQRIGIGAPPPKTATPKPGTTDKGEPTTPEIAPGMGAIIGVATDSLHGMDPLAGAAVIVVQRPQLHAVTTESGAFRIDSVPPGRYTLEMKHPVLDSIGIRLVSDSVTVNGGATSPVQFTVPSGRTLAAAVCTPAQRRFGPGVIAGRVIDAVTSEPAPGTEVSVAWTQTEISTTIGVRTVPHLRKATVAADGTYRICGVPSDFTGSLQAIRGAAKTAEVPIKVAADQALTVRVMYLPPPPPPAGAVAANGTEATTATTPVKRPTAVITGKVTNAGGVPVENARVSVQGAVASAETQKDGTFTLAGVPPGTQSVLIRRVGYTPVEMPLDVSMHTPNRITVRLGVYTPQLSSVEVKAKATDKDATGFTRRQKSGMGRYLTQDQIDDIRPQYVSDALRRIPGLYVSGSGYSTNVTTTRGNGCVRFLIDGNPVSSAGGQSIDELMNANDLAAVEFYNVSDVPLDLAGGGGNGGCALLALWTKGQLRDKDVKHR